MGEEWYNIRKGNTREFPGALIKNIGSYGVVYAHRIQENIYQAIN